MDLFYAFYNKRGYIMKYNITLSAILLSLLLCFSLSLAAVYSPQADYQFNSDTAVEYYNQGMDAFSHGKLEKADDLFHSVMRYEPNQALTLFQLGMLAMYQDQVSDAQKYLDQSQNAAKDAQLILQVEFIKSYLGNDKLAMQDVLGKLKKSGDAETSYLIYEAMNNFMNNKHHKTVTLLYPLAESFDFQIYYWLAKSYCAMGDLSKVNQFCTPILVNAPDLVSVLMMQGESFLNQGDYEHSSPIFSHILDLEPANLDAHCGSGKCLLFSHQADGALVHFQFIMDALDQKQLNWKCYWNIATCYTMLGRQQDALDVLTAFLDKCRSQSNPIYLAMINHKLAEYRYLTGEYQSAEQEYNNWIDWIDSSEFTDQFKLNQKARYYSDMIELSIMQNKNEKSNELNRKYQQLISGQNVNIRISDKLEGLFAYQNGEYQSAITAFERIPESSEKWYWIARCYEAMKNVDTARQYYSRLVDQRAVNFYSILYSRLAQNNLAQLNLL